MEEEIKNLVTEIVKDIENRICSERMPFFTNEKLFDVNNYNVNISRELKHFDLINEYLTSEQKSEEYRRGFYKEVYKRIKETILKEIAKVLKSYGKLSYVQSAEKELTKEFEDTKKDNISILSKNIKWDTITGPKLNYDIAPFSYQGVNILNLQSEDNREQAYVIFIDNELIPHFTLTNIKVAMNVSPTDYSCTRVFLEICGDLHISDKSVIKIIQNK